MTTEVWFRNPELYIRECAELLVTNFAWDRGYLKMHALEPNRLVELYMPEDTQYRQLVFGEQGTAELRPGRDLTNPVAVYPTWEYGVDEMEVLIEMLEHPVGENAELCSDKKRPPDERPVLGQEHRVAIIRPPHATTGLGKKFYKLLSEVQSEFPKAIIHVHGLSSFRIMFAFGYRSVDVDPRFIAKKGKVSLPSGKVVTYDFAPRVQQWVTVLGFSSEDLRVPRNRCMYNMKSALWAAEHYRENFKFKASGHHAVDPNTLNPKPATTSAVVTTGTKATVGDKFICDTCSLQLGCKYFRSGGVCSIPGSEPAPLATYFKTRDSEQIIEGLGTLLAAQTHRLERGLEDEDAYNELNPEVSKIIESLFNNGVKLAKLVNPSLAAAGATRVQVNTLVSGAAGTKQSMTANIVRELESRGVSRDQITPEMVRELLNPTEALDAVSVES